jgi:hypothetical protein
MVRKYNITVDEHQARILVAALDLYTRIGIGQFTEIVRVYNYEWKTPVPVVDRLVDAMNAAKQVIGFGPGASYGIHSPDVHDVFRRAYDIQCVIRHRLAFDRTPEGGLGVDFDTPRQIGELPLPTIKEEEEEEQK